MKIAAWTLSCTSGHHHPLAGGLCPLASCRMVGL